MLDHSLTLLNTYSCDVGLIRNTIRDVMPSEEEKFMTIANRLRAEGKAELLCSQLVDRFGSLPVRVQRRISSADESQLNAWGHRVLVASTLKDVFVVS